MSKRKKPNNDHPNGAPPNGDAPGKGQRRWYRVDLHVHTPGSNDYEEPSVSYLDILRTAVERDLDVIAITDHNTVAGIDAIRREIEWLTRLDADKRLTDEERTRLAQWRDLSQKVLVLPGFEFTATFGFHILAIFPPETPVRQLEHVLLTLNVPTDKLDIGSTETGSAIDVLSAYRIIHQAGGLVIAAHANSTHGVAMRNFPFGGQTKIAYTQDVNLDALEVTDLERSTQATARFFNGTKTEYPRRMHCIQGSDAHRLTMNPKNPKRLGIGERATEMCLDDLSFEGLAALLRGKQFDRTRPARSSDKPFDAVAAARAEGASLVQSFHESVSQRGGRFTAILNDICAFANTAGGTVYVGVGQRKGQPKGLSDFKQVQIELLDAVQERIIPLLTPMFDVLESEGVRVLRIQVPKGADRPYCLDGYRFYVRDESESSIAVRDEIVALVVEARKEPVDTKTSDERSESSRRRRRGGRGRSNAGAPAAATAADSLVQEADSLVQEADKEEAAAPIVEPGGADDMFYLPQIGVEIVDTVDRNGHKVHTICDLRNGNTIKNVSRSGARKLWNYAILQHEDHPVDPKKVEWKGNVGLVSCEQRAGKLRYDLALRENGHIRIFYGVTEDGMEGKWASFVREV